MKEATTFGVKYPNINAKLKGMYAKKITKEDLNDIIKQNNLKNAIYLLKNKYDIFKKADENIDRLEIEELLEENLIKEIKKILDLLERNDKELFEMFILQYEIKCVKAILRKLFSNDKTNDIVIKNVRNWTNILFDDIKGIETVQNFEEFFSAIKRMKYNKIFKKYDNYNKYENINVFYIENEIDKLYFETLYDSAKSIPNLKKIVGSEIDLLNILWIYRVKKYYNFRRDSINEILIKKYYKLDTDIIYKVIETENFEEIKNLMQKTVYKEVFSSEEYLEENIDKYLYSINKKIFKNDIISISYIYAYINMIDYENGDIINTIEGIRYNMEKDEILNRLVR